MTPCTEEAHRLLEFARRDMETFQILAGHPKASLAAMGFHAQQCALIQENKQIDAHMKAMKQ